MTEFEMRRLWAFYGTKYISWGRDPLPGWKQSRERLIFWQLVALSEEMYRGD